MLNIDVKEVEYVRFFVADDQHFDMRPQILPDDIITKLREPHILCWAFFSRLEGTIEWRSPQSSKSVSVPIKSIPFDWGVKQTNWAGKGDEDVEKMQLDVALEKFPKYDVSRLASDPMCPMHAWVLVSHKMEKIYLARDTWYGDD